MKPMILFVLVLCIIAFSACSVKDTNEVFCISDELCSADCPAFSMKVDIPADAVRITEAEDVNLFYEQGDYQIFRDIFAAENAEAGIKAITGHTAEELNAIHLDRFPQEEYRFSWTAAGENCDLVCVGALLFDGSTCYSVSFQCPDYLENRYRTVFYRIISDIELQPV